MKKKTCATLFGLLFVIMAACLMTGCSSEDKVVGSYAVDPSRVSSSVVDDPDTNVVIIAAASKNQAFRIPDSALSYAKAAIESENYVAYTVPDGSEIKGKIYFSTKRSAAAKEKELASFESDFFGSIAKARDTTGSVDVLSGMIAAANQLKSLDRESAKTICVVSSGICNDGLLATNQDLLAADPKSISEQLMNLGVISDDTFSGVKVRFYGLGQSTGQQRIPASARQSLERLYTSVVEAAGGTVQVATDQLQPLGCDEDLPEVNVVDLGCDEISLPALSAGESAQVVLDSTVLNFQGDNAEFIDEEQANMVLRAAAEKIINGGYSVRVDGYTAASSSRSDNFLMDLSFARAEAVKRTLVSYGACENMISVSGHGSEGSSALESGSFDEAQAALDRRVVLTLANEG